MLPQILSIQPAWWSKMAAAMALDTTASELKATGMPFSSVWSRFSSSPWSVMSPTRRWRMALRSLALSLGQGPSSKARRAARTARSTSAAEPTAKVVTTSLVAGFDCSQVPPSEASTHCPSM